MSAVVLIFFCSLICGVKENLDAFNLKKLKNAKKKILQLIEEENFDDAIAEIDGYVASNFLLSDDSLFELKILGYKAQFLKQNYNELIGMIQADIEYFENRISEKNLKILYRYYFVYRYYHVYYNEKVCQGNLFDLINIHNKYMVLKSDIVGVDEKFENFIQNAIERIKNDLLTLFKKDCACFENKVDLLLYLINQLDSVKNFELINCLYEIIVELITAQEASEGFDEILSYATKKVENGSSF